MPPKFEAKHGKLRVTHALYVVCLLSLGLLQAIGIGFFAKGFLLSRQVLDFNATCAHDACLAPAFSRAVVLVVDALRFDFAIPVAGSREPYHNNLRFLHELAQDLPEHALLLKFLADPPTTTLQRLKGLTTGSLPTFVDAGLNFDGDVIDEDNWIAQLWRRGSRVAFMGDDTWDALFRPYLAANMSFPYPSLDVRDLDTVDNGVIEHLFPLLAQPQHWDVLVGHFLGVDHVGHRFGPKHSSMRVKQLQMDEILRQVVDELDDDTLLVVLGDHGMTRTGDHGGDSPEELEAAVFFHAKRPFIHRKLPENYDIAFQGRNHRAVNQIDLVPTLSLLLGLPIPFNNLGAPIDELFRPEQLPVAHYMTARQINEYRAVTDILQGDDVINGMYRGLEKMWSNIVGETEDVAAGLAADPAASLAFVEAASVYHHTSLERCRDLWARFDAKLILMGITLIALSLIILTIYARLIPSVVISQMSGEFVTSMLAVLPLGLVVLGAIHAIIKPENLSWAWSLSLGVATAIVLGFFAPIFDRYSLLWLLAQARDLRDWWSLFGALCIVLHVLVFALNSFTIWEDKIITFLLSTFGFLCLVEAVKLTNKTARVIAVYHALVFLALTRAAALITLCREEQGEMCTPTFGLSWWAVALLYVVAIALPLSVRGFMKLTSSYQSAAPFWIGRGLTAVLLLNAFYWTMDFFESGEHFSARFSIDEAVLELAMLTVARIVMGVGLGAANFGWARGPLCIQLEFARDRRATILGYGNVYGASYLLFALNVASVVMLVSKPLGAVSIFILINQLLTLLELFDVLSLRKSLAAPVVFGLLATAHFFSTGHQATLSSIQWEVGSMTTREITMPFTHLNIFLNSFGSYVVVCVFLPLIVLWKIPPSPKPISLVAKAAECCATFAMYQTAVTLSTLVFAAVFRRHLMVWKIFAPRFMMGGIVLVSTTVMIVVVFGFGVGRVVKQMNKIFGK
ncbi:hypothetical protein BABINDRAFT_31375 [Babjeviella inositovora NRRL Y-12698]|uniref:Uncharacterized protein n=1 Tax=Babjeviella inositovora NRRL Y-12698 TaxID=984486 RepID=A0A1E3R0V8_9ASCO|nr:uncharacterized protein BABINDRAFT_31375 [Babjeviella inositovora NRRL Y-12698]ODQ82982.1 hypothetical protein BABINDRAFT_31375 [Babjeviella inositovora NRRL Y-12698]